VLDGTLALGEISLSGELRRVARVEARVREAAQLGFRRAGVPALQVGDARTAAPAGFEIVPLATVRDSIRALLGEKVATRPTGPGPAPAAAAEPAR